MIQNKRLLIIFAAILVIPTLWDWTEPNTTGGLGFIRNNLAWIAILALVTASFFRILSAKQIILPKGALYLLVGFLFAIAPFFSVQSFDTFIYGIYMPLGLLGCILGFLGLFQFTEFKKEKILLVIVVISLIEAIIGCWELFHSLMMQLTSGVDKYKVIHIDGTFNQRNVFATFISTGLIASFYLMNGAKLIVKRIKERNIIIVFMLVGSFILIFTSSRVGIFSCLFAILVLSFFQPFSKFRFLKTVSPVVIGFILAVFSQNMLLEGNGKDFSKTNNRQVIYSTSIEAIFDSPIIGHGLGSFEKVYLTTLSERMNAQDANKDGFSRGENLSHPHNEILYWGVQGGLISIFGLLIIVIAIIISTVRAGLRKNLIYYSLLFPVILHLMVELPFYISGVHILLSIYILFYIMVSIGEVKSYSLKISLPAKRAAGGAVGAIGIASIVLLSLNSYSLYQVEKFESALNRSENQIKKAIVKIGWDDIYQSLLLKHKANIAVRSGEQKPVIEYLDWLENQVKITPRLQYYINIYNSYRILGNQKKADMIKAEIKYYFSGLKLAEEWLINHEN